MFYFKFFLVLTIWQVVIISSAYSTTGVDVMNILGLSVTIFGFGLAAQKNFKLL